MHVDEEARRLQVQVCLLTFRCAACIDNSWLTSAHSRLLPHRRLMPAFFAMSDDVVRACPKRHKMLA